MLEDDEKSDYSSKDIIVPNSKEVGSLGVGANADVPGVAAAVLEDAGRVAASTVLQLQGENFGRPNFESPVSREANVTPTITQPTTIRDERPLAPQASDPLCPTGFPTWQLKMPPGPNHHFNSVDLPPKPGTKQQLSRPMPSFTSQQASTPHFLHEKSPMNTHGTPAAGGKARNTLLSNNQKA